MRPGAVASPNRGLGLEKWKKLAFFGDEPAKTRKLAKSPKRLAREASKALKQPAMGTKAQQALASQRETMKQESAHARSQRRAEEARRASSSGAEAQAEASRALIAICSETHTEAVLGSA